MDRLNVEAERGGIYRRRMQTRTPLEEPFGGRTCPAYYLSLMQIDSRRSTGNLSVVSLFGTRRGHVPWQPFGIFFLFSRRGRGAFIECAAADEVIRARHRLARCARFPRPSFIEATNRGLRPRSGGWN